MTGKILLLAFIVRLIVFGAASQGIFLIGEGRVEADLATNLLAGKGYMLSQEMLYHEFEEDLNPALIHSARFCQRVDGFYGVLRPGKPTIFLVPGYVFFMAGIFAVSGLGNFMAVRGVQLLLGLLTVLIGLKIAKRFLSGKFYVAAGIFMALDPFELYYEAIPATQALFSLFLLLSILLSLKLLENAANLKKALFSAALTGTVWAGAFYIRPAALPLMIWLIILLPFAPFLKRLLQRGKSEEMLRNHRHGVFSVRGLLTGSTVLLVFMILMLPWGLRNMEVCGDFRIMPTQGGVNIWEFNGRIFSEEFVHELAGANLLYGELRREYMGNINSPELAEFPEFRNEDEWIRDEILFRRSITFMLRNPVLTLRLISLRFIEFFKPFPLNAFSPLFTVIGLLSFFWVLFFLWGGGVRCLFRNGAEGFYLSTCVAGYALMHLLTASGTPHRVAADFPMAILALCGVAYSVRRYRASREREPLNG